MDRDNGQVLKEFKDNHVEKDYFSYRPVFHQVFYMRQRTLREF
jgi:hypothetical protein